MFIAVVCRQFLLIQLLLELVGFSFYISFCFFLTFLMPAPIFY